MRIALEIWRTLSEMAPYLLLGFAVSGLLSTPQTGADSVMVTYSLLGPVFAVFRPVAALLTGLLGGTLVGLFAEKDSESGPPKCEDACCATGGLRQTARWRRGFTHAFVSLPRDIGGAMAAGIVVAALIAALVPDSWIENSLAPGVGSMLVMMMAGIPVYVCATASVPIAAALIAKGLSPGAALVFLMTGPATNAAAIVTIWRALGGRTALLYLLTVAVSAILCGFALDRLLVAAGTAVQMHPHPVLPQWGHAVCAIVLILVLVNAWLGGRLRSKWKTESHS